MDIFHNFSYFPVLLLVGGLSLGQGLATIPVHPTLQQLLVAVSILSTQMVSFSLMLNHCTFFFSGGKLSTFRRTSMLSLAVLADLSY